MAVSASSQTIFVPTDPGGSSHSLMLIPVNDDFVFQLFLTISLICLSIIILGIAQKVASTNAVFSGCTTEGLCPVVQNKNEGVNSELFGVILLSIRKGIVICVGQ